MTKDTGLLDKKSSPGDISSEEFRKAGHELVDWIAEYVAHPERHAVLPAVEPGELRAKLPEFPPEHGDSSAAVLRDFENQILPHVTHWNHPGFMAYFAAGGSSAGVLSEALIAALNNVGLLWRSSPALAELEQVSMSWLSQLLGLPSDWFGMIHETASTASLHAVIAARQAALEAAEAGGRSLDLNRITIYASKQAHSSIEKTMAALGRGSDACRKIPCDTNFRMDPDALRDAIRGDIENGFCPIAVVATVGTTSASAVDPVPAIADLAEEFSLWLHVDAAYAGAAAILPEMRHYFEGCERADSFLTNPHKWLFAPMDLTAFYTAQPDILRRALSLVPEYLSSDEHPDAVNFMEYSIPLGRRFRGLKLWYILRLYGRERLAANVREHIRLASQLAGWIDESEGFERVAPTPFSLVCLRYRPSGATPAETDKINESLLNAVNATGEFFLSHTKLNERYVIRVAIGNLRTSEHYVARVWQLLREFAPTTL